ncbi:AAA domain-containing protein [Longispora sp. NPDC051575]|uniref:AAA domain-containing protein n=1 Tax=Longispora sp. NPDC051575 TaxID=3154943 RepID=UPI0034448BA9
MTGPETIRLARPVVFVPGRNLAEQMMKARAEHAHLPTPQAAVHELGSLSSASGVPVTFDGQWQNVYAHRCVLGVRRSRQGDVYYVERIGPITLRHHRELAAGAVLVSAPGWWWRDTLGTVPAGCVTLEPRPRTRPRTTTTPAPGPGPGPAETALRTFCAALDETIEAARQIEAATAGAAFLPYLAVSSTAATRTTTAGVYAFHLARPGQVGPGAWVELRAAPDLRGRVVRLDGAVLTVRFANAVDRRRIADQGELVLSANTVIPNVQSRAVRALRDGTSRNPALARILVDGAFAPLSPPDRRARPAEDLDTDQLEAFHRALSAPEILLVQGPPGTGKTRTIVELTRALVARGERVLVASHTHRAVDNVIERLPESVRVLRVGDESKLSAQVRQYTIGALASRVQQQILDLTVARAQHLAPWSSPIPAVEAALARLTPPDPGRLALAEQAEQHARHAVDVRLAEVRRCEERVLQATARKRGLLGFVFGLVADHRGAAVNRARATAGSATAEHRAALDAVAALRTELDRCHEIAVRLRARVASVTRPPEVERTAASVAAFDAWIRRAVPMFRARAELIGDWRAQLAQPSDQLHPELVRYAEVVGSTCIGVGVGRNLLADLDFDVAIVDEAGQIPLATTLVPLVRARRAVLVGDHRQLPPLVDDDVRAWLRHTAKGESGALVELLSTSGFERLITTAPDSHRILLGRQRRMPKEIGDFVSDQFYGGRLSTATPRRRPPALFDHPLVLLNTADARPTLRAERRWEGNETFQVPGYDNPLEADLIVDLVQHYERCGREWAVIVPYRAQIQRIRTRLESLLGDRSLVDANLGSVDAFQGGERDVVVYGFTRSNPRGDIGFLSELRRLNVAISRSKEQLVLVGDVDTLGNARHPEFRALFRALVDHAGRHGQVLRSGELRALIAEALRSGV